MHKVRVETFSEVFDLVDILPTHSERVEALSRYSGAIIEFLRWTFDPAVQLKIDTKMLNYRPVAYSDGLESSLYRVVRSFYVFAGEVDLKKKQLFERTLESVSARDAELLIGMVNKKLPYKNINLRLISDAFPNMFPKTLDMEAAIQETPKESEPEVKVKKPQTWKCVVCDKELKSLGGSIMHLKCVHKFSNGQLDEYRKTLNLKG